MTRRHSAHQLGHIKEAVEETLRRAQRAGTPRNINVAHRVNKAVSANIGEPNSVQGASSHQSVTINQDPGGTSIESHDTTTTTHGTDHPG
jgi:hypothetical protein